MIGRMGRGQADAVMRIWLDANIGAHPFIPAPVWRGLFEDVRTALAGADVYVYQDSGEVVGFIGITEGWCIAGLFVADGYRSRGIGKALLDHAKQIYPCLELDVFTENEGAVEFYRRNGFEVVKKRMNPDFLREEYRMIWRG